MYACGCAPLASHQNASSLIKYLHLVCWNHTNTLMVMSWQFLSIIPLSIKPKQHHSRLDDINVGYIHYLSFDWILSLIMRWILKKLVGVFDSCPATIILLKITPLGKMGNWYATQILYVVFTHKFSLYIMFLDVTCKFKLLVLCNPHSFNMIWMTFFILRFVS